MHRINCPSSECLQRTSSGEERDDDVCAIHINKTLDQAGVIDQLVAANRHMPNKLYRIAVLCDPVQVRSFPVLQDVLDICMEQLEKKDEFED